MRNAIRAKPAAVDLMCKLLRLVAGRSALLWVGCGCGEEILAILREVRGVYIVALELNKSDLDTFRSTLGAAKGVLPVDGDIDVFRLKRNGAKVRLVWADAGSLSNEQFDALARPLPITHMFSFAIGPSGWWMLHMRLVEFALEFAWSRGMRAVLPLKMWESAGQYNLQLYHEHQPGPALCTLPGQLDMEQLKLLLPFLNVMGEARAIDGSVLGRDGAVLKNHR